MNKMVATALLSVMLSGPALAAPASKTRHEYGFTEHEFVHAVGEGDGAAVQKLLSKGMSPNARNKDGVSAVAMAASHGHLAILKDLLSRKADVNVRDNFGGNAVFWACTALPYEKDGAKRLLPTLELLVRAGADINAHGREGGKDRPPLHILVAQRLMKFSPEEAAHLKLGDLSGRDEVFLKSAEFLIAHGADVNAADINSNTTPLHTAAQHGDEAMVRLLLARGADPLMEDVNAGIPSILLPEKASPALYDYLVNEEKKRALAAWENHRYEALGFSIRFPRYWSAQVSAAKIVLSNNNNDPKWGRVIAISKDPKPSTVPQGCEPLSINGAAAYNCLDTKTYNSTIYIPSHRLTIQNSIGTGIAAKVIETMTFQ